jgi:hypothetical protein
LRPHVGLAAVGGLERAVDGGGRGRWELVGARGVEAGQAGVRRVVRCRGHVVRLGGAGESGILGGGAMGRAEAMGGDDVRKV